jgi:hypothetical protein
LAFGRGFCQMKGMPAALKTSLALVPNIPPTVPSPCSRM